MRSYALYIAAAAFFAAFFVYYARIGDGHFIVVTDALAAIYAISALLTGVYALQGKQNTDYYASLGLIAIGLMLWGLAELLWLFFTGHVYLLVEGLRLLGYIPMLFGFFFILRTANPKFFEQKGYILPALASVIVFSVVSLILAPVLSDKLSLLDSITINGYILVDVTLLVGIMLLVHASYRYRGTFLSLIWVCFALSFLAIFTFDIMFASIWQQYYFGHPYEILILASYVLMGLGFYFYHLYCRTGGKDEAAL